MSPSLLSFSKKIKKKKPLNTNFAGPAESARERRTSQHRHTLAQAEALHQGLNHSEKNTPLKIDLQILCKSTSV